MEYKYKKLTPFKLQCLTNFPFIDEDFDALTNYGLLCKIVEYLNTISSNNNLLIDNINELNNWFKNLNVQNEINKKLDEMAESGEFDILFSKYVNPILENLNIEVNRLNEEIRNVASGSPAGVYNTLEELQQADPNHDKIYVVLEDGEWYFWNTETSQWKNGGVYQATMINDNSITYEKLSNNLKNSFTENTIPTNVKCNLGYYINQYNQITGDGTNKNRYGYYEIDVNGLESYYINISESTTYLPANYPLYIIKDINENIIESKTIGDYSIVNGYVSTQLNIPSNGTKLLLNSAYPVLGYILKINNYIVNNISKKQLDSKLQSIFTDVYEVQSPTLFIPDRFLSNDNLTSYNASDIYVLNVNPGEKYKISIKQIYTQPVILFPTDNIELTQDNYTFNKTQDIIKNQTADYQFENYEFVIPEYCTKIYINKIKTDNVVIEKSVSFKVKADDVDTSITNPLYNKNLGFVGDSVLAATTPGVKGWIGIMEENNPNTNFYNYGHDGYTIGYRDDRPESSIQGRLQALLNEHPNLDYVLIQGGINDFYQSQYIPIGNVSDNYTTFNRNTFAGGLETMIKMIRDTIPNAKIGFIATHKITYASDIVNYYNIAKQICDKWSIGYCDLFNRGQLNMLFMANNYSTNGDGTHPNLAGYELETPILEKWLKYSL